MAATKDPALFDDPVTAMLHVAAGALTATETAYAAEQVEHALFRLSGAIADLERVRTQIVRELRAQGVTWDSIAHSAGYPHRSSAQKRWGPKL